VEINTSLTWNNSESTGRDRSRYTEKGLKQAGDGCGTRAVSEKGKIVKGEFYYSNPLSPPYPKGDVFSHSSKGKKWIAKGDVFNAKKKGGAFRHLLLNSSIS
jgi:hypothetical protein